MEASQPRKPGRPRKFGQRPGWMGGRAAFALALYQRARESGMTDRKAKCSAIIEFTRAFPGERLSETEVNRILRHYQPHRRAEVWLGKILSQTEIDQTLPRHDQPPERAEVWRRWLEKIIPEMGLDADTVAILRDWPSKARVTRAIALGLGPRPKFKRQVFSLRY